MRRSGLLALFLLLTALLAPTAVQAAEDRAGGAASAEVDLALVLAVDASASVGRDHWELQRQGYVEAFRNADVIGAIANGTRGGVAVTMVEWSGPAQQQQAIGWTIIRDAASAHGFAAALAEAPRLFSDSTSISGAIDFSVPLLKSSGFTAARLVIDVSGDGSSNMGRASALARDEAVAAGVTINGLPILGSEPDIDTFYRDHVIGGPSAFMVVARSYESFATAILRKLVREIAGEAGEAAALAALPSPE